VSRARGIAGCAYSKTRVSEGTVRTVTAIVSAVWLVVSGDGGVAGLLVSRMLSESAFPMEALTLGASGT
jgi:hypothetical protein